MRTQQLCSRCGDLMRAFVMSRFNTDVICPACADDERYAPRYQAALIAEEEALRSGDRSFPGIGLEPQDIAVLKARLAKRARSEDSP